MTPKYPPGEIANPTPGRLVSLDAFRGVTIAGMILVNNPGNWEHVYPPLRHAAWHGWTPTDLIFPSFLFIVGVSIALALGKRVGRGDSRGMLIRKVVVRSVLIFAIALFMQMFPFDTLRDPAAGSIGERVVSTLKPHRIPGVLQRISLCYLAASLIYLFTGVRTLVAVTVALLLGYWALMTKVPVPDFGPGDLGSMRNNLASWLDRRLLAGHIYKQDYDPEGILSTLPSIATTLIGVLVGRWLGTARTVAEKACGVFAGGSVLFSIGWAWASVFPLNKALWTSSFALYCAGLSMLGLGLCMWLIEVMGVRKWAGPFVVFGSNAIAAYVLSGLLAKVLPRIKVAGPDGSTVAVKTWYLNHALAWADPTLASFLCALTYVLIWFLVLAVLYKLRLFIRV